jgi:single-stranded-DNA-specific exonuclease
MINKWIYRTLSEQQIETQNKLAEELSINPVLAQLLVQRDICSFDDARSFFRPDLANLHDPFFNGRYG